MMEASRARARAQCRGSTVCTLTFALSGDSGKDAGVWGLGLSITETVVPFLDSRATPKKQDLILLRVGK